MEGSILLIPYTKIHIKFQSILQHKYFKQLFVLSLLRSAVCSSNTVKVSCSARAFADDFLILK